MCASSGSQEKEAYDVFICAKISPIPNITKAVLQKENGEERTEERVEAIRIWKELVKEAERGKRQLKVFFSEISVAGIKYDQQIWSAMLRSKNILVIGAQKEHLESAWVKSEWMRWIYLIEKEKAKSATSFIAYIPNAREWSTIRPDQWDSSRVQIKKSRVEIDSWIQQMRTEGSAIDDRLQEYQREHDKLVCDIRTLLELGDYDKADRYLEDALDEHAGDGEMRFLCLRRRSKNFSDINAVDPVEFSLCCRLIQDSGKKLKKNPEYLAYQAAQKKQDIQRKKDERTQCKALKNTARTNQKPERWNAWNWRSFRLSKFFVIPVCVLVLSLIGFVFYINRDSLYNKKEDADQKLESLFNAAEAGDLEAQYSLANLYYTGTNGVEKNHNTAIVWFNKAAEQGHTDSQYWLGYCYENGYGIARDVNKAEEWYLKASRQGNIEAHSAFERLNQRNFEITNGVVTKYIGNKTNVIIPDGVTSIGYYAFGGCSDVTSITIPDSVTSIGISAFFDCNNLTSITIGKGVISIGSSVFLNCTELASITVAQDNPAYYSEGNCLIKKDTNILIAGCKSSLIPNNVTHIGSYAFECCEGRTDIVIPSSVTSIGIGAFDGCTELTTIYYGGVASEWANVVIDSSNLPLSAASVYYYCEIQPSVTGNHWHYVDNFPAFW